MHLFCCKGCEVFGNLTLFFQMTNTIQKKFKVSSTQLLYQSCPYQATTLLITGPFLDKLLTGDNVFAFNYTQQVLVRAPHLSWTRNKFVDSYLILFLYRAGFHHTVLLDLRVRQFQHVSSNWKNFSSHISSSWTFENLLSFGIRICPASWSI